MQEQYLNVGLDIIKTLNSFTYQAYLIGGVVRDYLMQNNFADIDIATNATPDQIYAIFPEVNMEYKHLGFVTLKKDGYNFEISTFKIEEYDEPRKPSKIYYAQELIDDVKRRDFTINALALTANLKVVDLVKGQKDIKRKIVRIIGKPKVRFKEDPLRILRAYNIVAKYNFGLSLKTIYGIIFSNKYLKSLSNYQVSRELYKIFEAPYGKKAIDLLVENKTHKALKYYKKGMPYVHKYYKKLSTIEKLTLCYHQAQQIPDNTSFDRNLLNKINDLYQLVELTKGFKKKNKENITEKDVFTYGAENLMSATKINYYTIKKYPKLFSKIKKIDKNLPIHAVSDLELSGKDVVALNNNQSGPYVKIVMDELVDEVIIGMIKNNHAELLVRAQEIIENMDINKAETHKVEEEKQEQELEVKKVDEAFNEVYVQHKPLASLVSDETIRLKIHYDMEYNELVKTSMASFLKGSETEEEVKTLQELVGKQVKEALLSQNPEYHILEQKGLI